MMTKGEYRKKYTEIRASIDDKRRDIENKIIADKLFDMDEYKSAETVFVYVSYGTEVDTKKIIKKMLTDGKRVAVPLCDTESHTMSLILTDGLERLTKGAYGIYEPNRDEVLRGEMTEITESQVDLAIVPGLCFDVNGNRLGYGGGYYDRFLENFNGFSVGLAFSDCVTEFLYTEEHDCRVNRVIHAEKER